MQYAFIIILSFLSLTNYAFSADNKALLKQAMQLQNQEQHEKAIDIYSQILKKDNDNKPALMGRSYSNIMLNNLDLVIEDMNHYIALDSANPDAYNNRGLARMYSDSAIYAVRDFNRAIALDSNFAEAYLNAGIMSLAANLDDLAEQQFKKSISLSTTNIEAYKFLGFVSHRLAKYDQAIESFNNAITKGLINADIYNKRANSFYKLEKYKEAVADYTKCLSLDSTMLDALNNRALAYSELNNSQAASDDRMKLAQLNAILRKSTDDGIDINSLKNFAHPSNKFSINMPSQFNVLTYSDSIALVSVISLEELKSPKDYFSNGVIIEYIDSTQNKLNLSSASDLLGYWENISSGLAGSYLSFQPFYKKQKTMPNNRFYYLSKSRIQVVKNAPAQLQYFIGYFQDNKIVTCRFLIPENLSYKYEAIVLKAIDEFRYE